MSESVKKILLAEDDPNLGPLLTEYLKMRGYNVTLAQDGEKAFELFKEIDADICLLDVMMPVRDGFTVAKQIRESNSNVPIIFLTAKNLTEDVIEGFKTGADDYITKPFNMEELLYRIEAIMRRTNQQEVQQEQSSYTIGKFSFSPQNQLLTIKGENIRLTTKESELLKLLCKNINGILQRSEALEKVWKEDTYFNARSMDVYITKLRKILKKDPAVKIINVHGKGYKLLIDTL